MIPLSIVVAGPIYRGPGPLPQILSGKGANNGGQFEGGQLVQAILTKAVFTCKGSGSDAILGSTVTSVLPSSWS